MSRRVAVFTVVYRGEDGNGKPSVKYASTCERERDKWIESQGKNSHRYSKAEQIENLTELGQSIWNGLSGIERLAISMNKHLLQERPSNLR